jgi:hypothetical protein
MPGKFVLSTDLPVDHPRNDVVMTLRRQGNSVDDSAIDARAPTSELAHLNDRPSRENH